MSNSLHEAKSNASSSYVTHYHMTREPFGDTIENDLFYAEPGRQQKLDILLHLTQYGNELVLVTGPSGSGKTTLLQQYLTKALDNWSVTHIDAQNGIDERKLLQQLFHQMNLEFHGATHSELFERMTHHFDALQHSARQAVMLVDNAEHLPVTALKRILEMAVLTNADNKPLIRIILFGTNDLINHFDDPLLAQYADIVQRSVELLPFTQEHTAHYILHRLSAANFSADKPFTDAVLHKIHKQSHGWPGKINQLAHDVLIETLPSNTSLLGNTSRRNLLRATGVFMMALFVLTMIFFQDEFNAWVNQTPAPAPQPPAKSVVPAHPETATLITAETSDMAAPAPEMITPPETTTEMPSEADAETITEPAAEPISETETEVAEATPSLTEPTPKAETVTSPETTEPAAAESPITLPTETPAAALPADTPVANAASPIPDDLPGFRNKWIREQNPSHYTLQLVAGNNLKTVRSFLSQHQPDGPLAIYHTTRQGKPWFGLIQHSYPSKQAAIDARAQLPASLRRQNPWVRTFASLQNDLQQIQ